MALLAPGGTFAMQVPGNFDQPTHRIIAELAAEPGYSPHVAGGAPLVSHDAPTYLSALRAAGCRVDAWETTYMHVLHGADAVFEWVRSTGAKTTLEALPIGLRERFIDEARRRLRKAYPVDDRGDVVMPFRRVFAVATLG